MGFKLRQIDSCSVHHRQIYQCYIETLTATWYTIMLALPKAFAFANMIYSLQIYHFDQQSMAFTINSVTEKSQPTTYSSH